jgi:hypothetical protein
MRLTPITPIHNLQDRRRRKPSKEDYKKMGKKPPNGCA